MSQKIFRCQDCGYETEVYEGRGFMGQHIEAMSCPGCRNIVPLVVGGVIGDAASSFEFSCRKAMSKILVLTGFTGGIYAQRCGSWSCNPLA